ncbi:hypothetical protein OG979_11630 [Actinomadura citrea]|uniref:hypothetical protein n=1 Tax=Actinomadura citrea TaxID=46158 RepID=UPI002E29C396|nr:hypothetical protein [Actinomadura citrea]
MQYFTETGWVAIFSGGGPPGSDTAIGRTRPVDGWHAETGMALVADPKQGKLRPVTDWDDFAGLERAERAIAALPGGGWRAHWKDEAGGPLTQPVLAWLIGASGSATPITIDTSWYEDRTDLSEPDYILAPGEDPESRAAHPQQPRAE